MDIQLSEEGRKLYSKMVEKLKVLHLRVTQESELFEKSPSYTYTRAKNSVQYYEKLLEEQEEVTKRRLEAIRLECEQQRQQKERWLKDAKEKLLNEESKKPRTLLRAEQELSSHILKMKASLPLPSDFYSKYSHNPSPGGEVKPPAPLPTPPPVQESLPPAPPPPAPEPPKKQVSFEEWSEGCDRFFGVDEELKKAREQARESIQRQEKPSYYSAPPPPPQEEDRPRIIQTTKKPIKKVAPR